MHPQPDKTNAFTLVEVLVATAVIAAIGGLAIVGITGVRENAREARLLNDVTVVNNGIDAYRASGGVIPADASAEQVLAKLKTVADSSSTAFGPPGPFIDPRLQISMQSSDEGATPDPRADYPNSSGYFYVRKGGAAGIKEFIRGAAGAVVTETRQGPMSYTPGGEFLTAYNDRPAATPVAAAAPASVGGEDKAADTGKDLVKFPKPCDNIEVRKCGSTNAWTPYGGELLAVSTENGQGFFPAQVRISSGFSSSVTRLAYKINGGAEIMAPTDPYILPVCINPGDTVSVRVISLDSTRYVSSDPCLVPFNAEPACVETPTECPPPSLTYAEAGGAMVGQSVVTRDPFVVELKKIAFVPPEYRASEYLETVSTTTYTARYTGAKTTVTNTGFSAPGFSNVVVPIDVAGFGSNTSIRVQAEVIFYDPQVICVEGQVDCTVSIQPIPLTVDVLPLKPIGLPPNVVITHSGNVPVGLRKFYTLTAGSAGAAPLNPTNGGTNIASAILYSAPITNYPIATYTVVAQATGPAGAEHWFTCSPVNRTYIAITTVPLRYIGLNMFKANINGYVKGSIYMQAGDFAVLNAGAIVEGNVYLPGMPSVFLPAAGGLVAQKGKTYNQSNDAGIATNRITGREYTTEGKLADPQADTRKIVDLYGSTTPNNYEFRATETSRVDGKVYRRADPPPVTSQKPGLPSGMVLSNAAVTVTGTNTLAAGSYALTLNNTNSVLRLGSPGTITSYVFGAGSTWAGGRVEILGPVQIYFNSNMTMSDVTFGSSNSIYQTGFVVMSNYSFAINSGATVYGQFEARDSTISVGNGGKFYGSAFANEVAVSGQGFVDVSGGSDTNSATSTNAP